MGHLRAAQSMLLKNRGKGEKREGEGEGGRGKGGVGWLRLCIMQRSVLAYKGVTGKVTCCCIRESGWSNKADPWHSL